MITFKENHIVVNGKLPKPKRITGTRFAAILGLNNWATPFAMWCEITKVYEKPFESTMYTEAGNIIEPLVVKYLREEHFRDLDTPEDVYGPDPFKATWGNFFADKHDILGGMWDALGHDDSVIEIKTTQRAEDWLDEIPPYYKLQAALYAYLLGYDDVTVTVSFLQPHDYNKPEEFVPSADNTKIYEFKMSEDFPDFETNEVATVLKWWDDHVVTGISPEFDEKADAEILRELRTAHLAPTDDTIKEYLERADELAKELAIHDLLIKDKQKELKELEGKIKEYMDENMNEDETFSEMTSDNFVWKLTRSTRKGFDKKSFEKDDPDAFAKYETETEVLTLRKSEVEK